MARPLLGSYPGSRLVLPLLMVVAFAAPAVAQVPAKPMLHGKVFVGDTTLAEGRVVLHRISASSQGAVDSTQLGRDGSFVFHLPSVPDSARHEIYFAIIQHDGVLYFGSPITLPIQLDSVYEIHAYDTTMVAPEGVSLPIQVRNVFIEPDSIGWRVTDLIEVHNEEKRTLTARADGVVWKYPLPAGASDYSMGQTGLALDAATFENGSLVVRAPIPPGDRLFVIRYAVPDPFITIPLPGSTAAMEMLIREPAPTLSVTGLGTEQSLQLEAGTTYRHFVGQDMHDTEVSVKPAAKPRLPPVRWFAVILALLLAGFGLKALQSGEAKPADDAEVVQAPVAQGRDALLWEIARLDEDFESAQGPSQARRESYAARRAALIRRLRGQGQGQG